jgi:hypothetical protein
LERTIGLADHIEEAGFRYEVSAHAGLIVNQGRLLRGLDEAGVPVTSIDVPDVNGLSNLRKILLSMLNHSMREGAEDPDLHRGMLMNHIGWLIHNSPTSGHMKGRVENGISNGTTILKANGADFREGCPSGNILLDLMNREPDQRLFVEIDPKRQRYVDWFDLVANLEKEFPGRVGLSFDGGHLFNARQNDDLRVEQFFRTILADPNKRHLVGMLEVNQPIDGTPQTHQGPFEGIVDYLDMLQAYGDAHELNSLPFKPRIILESHPRDFNVLISERGIEMLQKFRSAYDGT